MASTGPVPSTKKVDPVTSVFVEERRKVAYRKLDYSGAHDKTNPCEIASDTVGHGGQDTSWGGILDAAKDPKAWLFVC
ncbi:uncharacterized protein F5Z01DRAFT_676084 [Emericellopsis atlantica]|uniref:Uncharacterized protein n=1 Tax=Emericellopsis atlantica TaxID=2614577 RepID=A0A9P7ZI98_9HYPO|nr:uncharacterized protein F5Z01DRAFT_676084 [Emericellopsis atlantica]KAG9252197.1 hypothetical protein F5Z01DRAFT_676084 [Emericellopsis atlantica]